MWGRKSAADIVNASMTEAQAARGLIDEGGAMLSQLESELAQVLSSTGLAAMTSRCDLLEAAGDANSSS